MKLTTPDTPLFRKEINELISAKEKFISLGLGEPEIETPQQIKDAAYNALLDGYTKYSNPLGLENLREAISLNLKSEKDFEAGINNIMVTPGGKNALFISCMGLVEDGDEIINMSPCYISNIPILNLASRKITIKNIPLLPPLFRIDRQNIEDSISAKTKIILMNFPNNPTGATLMKEDAGYLATLVKEKNIYIISDEVYDKYIFEGESFSPAGLQEIKDKVITINSFSKSSFMTGWRIGYVYANADIIKELAKINLHINTNTATFIQKAALEAMKMDNSIFLNYKNELVKRRKIFSDIMMNMYPDFKLPNGGLFVFLDISDTKMKSDEFCARLLKTEKVAVQAGINFGENYDNYCRISFTCNTEEFEGGILKIKKFIENS